MKEGKIKPGRGVWFTDQEGLWYRSRYDVGKIQCISVDGHAFFPPSASQPAVEADTESQEYSSAGLRTDWPR